MRAANDTQLENLRIVFLGPGVMAEGMGRALITKKLVAPDQILMGGPRRGRLDRLASEYGFDISEDNKRAVQEGDLIVISVKPQSVPGLMNEIKGNIPEDALVLSIVAGMPLEQLVDGLAHDAIVRTMPNTPAQVGQGITAWTATDAVGEDQLAITRAFLTAFGQELHFDNQDYLDMATALSGTGPAYVYLFMEAMVDAGVHLGFPRRFAEQLVVQTVKGSVAYYEYSPAHMARLRNQVTSPGGTSAAAIYYLERAGFRTAISRAIWAAYERSVELGKGK